MKSIVTTALRQDLITLAGYAKNSKGESADVPPKEFFALRDKVTAQLQELVQLMVSAEMFTVNSHASTVTEHKAMVGISHGNKELGPMLPQGWEVDEVWLDGIFHLDLEKGGYSSGGYPYQMKLRQRRNRKETP